MSILSQITNAIFGHRRAQASEPAANIAPMGGTASAGVSAMPQMGVAPAGLAGQGGPSVTNPQGGVQAQAAQQPVDVEAVLTEIEASKGQPNLNWRSSIVDLMKLLDLDSSLDNRKALATELGYTGPKDGSAEMNLWLHRKVMESLEQNGGRVPASLKD